FILLLTVLYYAFNLAPKEPAGGGGGGPPPRRGGGPRSWDQVHSVS
ncbi:hypothetical protein, partial [Pseudomonas aeruginosa]